MEANTETNLHKTKEEIKTGQAEMKAAVSAILREMKSWQEKMKVYPEKWEENAEEMKSIVEHQEVPKGGAAVKTVKSTEGVVLGPGSSHRVLLTAEETDPGRWWLPEEVGRYLRRVD
jgi:hypothetical protein